MELLPEDVLNLIFYKIDINDICNMFGTNKYFNNMAFSWKNYLEINTPNKFDNVDKEFMKIHGKYLVKINKHIDVNQWLHFFETLLEINKNVLLYRHCSSKIEFSIIDDPFAVIEIVIEHYNNNIISYEWYTYNNMISPTTNLNGPLLNNMIDVLINNKIKSVSLNIVIDLDKDIYFELIKDLQ